MTRPKSSPARDPGDADGTLADHLRHQLEADIFAGILVPGQRLDEQELAKRFGVSRTPVREALRNLNSSGLVDMRARLGATVAKLTLTSLIEMFQVMAELEGLCARLASRRIAPEQRKILEAEHGKMMALVKSESDPMQFYESNKIFHDAIYQASQNAFLIGQTLALRARVAPYRRYVTFQPGRTLASVDEHEAVVQAILSGKEDEAHGRMREHVNLLGDGLADFISALPSNLLLAQDSIQN